LGSRSCIGMNSTRENGRSSRERRGTSSGEARRTTGQVVWCRVAGDGCEVRPGRYVDDEHRRRRSAASKRVRARERDRELGEQERKGGPVPFIGRGERRGRRGREEKRRLSLQPSMASVLMEKNVGEASNGRSEAQLTRVGERTRGTRLLGFGGDFCHYKTRQIRLRRNGGVGEGFDDLEIHGSRSRQNRLKISFMRRNEPLSSCI
jgi:hypothetical protein